MDEKIKLRVPVAVEGKYDKIALSSLVDANVITTDGFGIFNNSEKKSLLRRLSENGLVVLCDSDGAGGVIRSHISSFIPKEKIYPLYVPRIEGKEKRKRAPSKEGVLGVEGVPHEVLYERLSELVKRHPELVGDAARGSEEITKTDLFVRGLTGGENSSELRARFAEAVGLPGGMTSGALLSAINMLLTREEFFETCEKLGICEKN